nr:hypothetical protein [Tanacetum cinerariifolium]
PAAAQIVVAAYTRRRKRVIIRDPEEELPLKTPAETLKVKDKGKGILVEAPKPMRRRIILGWMQNMQGSCRKRLIGIMMALTRMLIRMLQWNMSIKNLPAAKRRKLSEEPQEAEDLRKRLEVVEDEDDDVFVEATPLASKVLIMDYQIVLIDNKP